MTGTKDSSDRFGVRRIVQVVGFLVLMLGLIFGLAGHWDWWNAWILLGLYAGAMLTLGMYALRRHPGLINERGKAHTQAKGWDRVLMSIYTVVFLALFGVAGLDERLGWSEVPLWLQVLGGVGFILAMVWVYWVMYTNAYLSSYVRIQTDRGHRVVTEGPYRFVRHPMYAGMFLFFFGIPIMLNSWWALIPGVIIMLIFIIRTVLEDRTLQAELPGYAEYARKVRYRLIPGIW